METLGITENRYSGIPTIQRELRLAGMAEAVFSNSRNEFAVTFYNNEVRQEMLISDFIISSGEVSGILEFCKVPRSRSEIAQYLRIKTIYYMMSHYVNPLLETGQLKMTIPQKPKSKNQKYYSVAPESQIR